MSRVILGTNVNSAKGLSDGAENVRAYAIGSAPEYQGRKISTIADEFSSSNDCTVDRFSQELVSEESCSNFSLVRNTKMLIDPSSSRIIGAPKVLQGDRFVPVGMSKHHLIRNDSPDMLRNVLTLLNKKSPKAQVNSSDNTKESFNQKLESGIKNLLYSQALVVRLFESGAGGSKRKGGLKQTAKYRHKEQKTRLMTYARKLKGEGQQRKSSGCVQWSTTGSKQSGCSVLDILGKLKTEPIRVLDAPELPEDTFCQLIDWSHDNKFFLAIGKTVYKWCPVSQKSFVVCAMEGLTISALKCHPSESKVLFASQSGQLWMANTESSNGVAGFDVKCISILTGGFSFITALATSIDVSQDLVAVGSRIFGLSLISLDSPDPVSRTLNIHERLQDGISGMKFSLCGRFLAVGGCSGGFAIMRVLDETLVSFKPCHKGPVRAIAWSPRQSGMVISASTDNSGSIFVWNAFSGQLVKTLQVEGPVYELRYALRSDVELLIISSGSDTHVVSVIQTEDFQKIGEFCGHSKPVLHLTSNMDNSIVVTASADESIRFWNLFPPSIERTVDANKSNFPQLSLR